MQEFNSDQYNQIFILRTDNLYIYTWLLWSISVQFLDFNNLVRIVLMVRIMYFILFQQ